MSLPDRLLTLATASNNKRGRQVASRTACRPDGRPLLALWPDRRAGEGAEVGGGVGDGCYAPEKESASGVYRLPPCAAGRDEGEQAAGARLRPEGTVS
jgi:hypothetical protein